MRVCYVLLSVAVAGRLVAGEPVVVDRGANHRVWEWTVDKNLADGTVIKEKHGYTELAGGMHFLSDGQWAESQEVIEFLNDGAAALHGQHKVIFSPNLNSSGAIVLILPDGRRMTSHVLGLAYVDSSTGQSALIAAVKDSTGEIHLPNQVLYPSAFESVSADVRYTYTRTGWEQDVILRPGAILPAPESYNMGPETTRLEIWTEFVQAPSPIRQTTQSGVSTADARADGSDLQSEDLDFGTMRIGQGRAFLLPEQDRESSIEIKKRWEEQDGRRFLIEGIAYPTIQKQMEKLQQAAAPTGQRTGKANAVPSQKGQLARQFPAAPAKATGRSSRAMRLAAIPPPNQGLVLDYVQTLTGGLSNYVFAADTTYYISGNVTVNGTNTVFEGGTVIKHASGVSLWVQSGNVDFQGTAYHPVAFTAKDDNTWGETVTGSSGTPNGSYANPALRVTTGTTNVLKNLRIRYAATGLEFSGANNLASHVQLLQVQTGVKAYGGSSVQVALRNILAAGINEFLSGANLTAAIEHLTLANANYLSASGATPTVALTNCLLAAVTNTGTYSGEPNQAVNPVTGVFQAAGAGQYYLPTNSAYLGYGTTNINSDLKNELAQRTTYAPTIISNVTYTTNAILGPTAPRGTGTPSLGYYYDALDYLMTKVTVNGATVTLANGAAVGLDYSGGNNAITLGTSGTSSFLSLGIPLNLNRMVLTQSVQEQPASGIGGKVFDVSGASAGSTYLRLRFTDLAQMAGGCVWFSGTANTNWGAIELAHSQVRGGNLTFYGGAQSSPPAFGWTNTLFERASIGCYPYSLGYNTLLMYNNLCRGGALYLALDATKATTSLQYNVFDNVTASVSGVFSYYNGYINMPVLYGSSGSDVTNSVFAYQSGPLGRYYQPSGSIFVDKGGAGAAGLGLYHFTTTTNQVKEGTSSVDFGLHYLALDGNGRPTDYDGDGLVDYLEDQNGNGSRDGSLYETDWQTYTTITNNVPGLQVFTPLK